MKPTTTLHSLSALAVAQMLFVGSVVRAEARGAETAATAQPVAVASEPRVFASKHQGTFNDVPITYTAKVAETVLRDGQGRPEASIFTISYIAERRVDATRRPVLFLFNGGPGSSSVWLHLGGFGPQRVPFGDDLSAGVSAPYALASNPRALLDVADLVFIDPVGTGFSRLLAQPAKSKYYSTRGDAESIAEVVNRWVHEHGRENSPKYIVGESYGTIRAPVLAQKLAESDSAIRVNGLILLGPAVTLGDTATRPGNVLAYSLSLTYMAATAWYHGAVEQSGIFEEFLDRVRDFARTEYLPALAAGRLLEESRRREIADQLQGFTGIAASHWLRNDLAIKKPEFNRELLRDRGLILGEDDARYTAPGPRGRQGDRAVDPSSTVVPALAAGLNRHLRDNLRVAIGEPYRIFDPTAGSQWNWGPPNSPFSDFSWASTMSALMKANPQMRVFYGVGYYDPKTTVGATEYTVAQADYPLERVELRRYHSGHMIYTDERSHVDLARDLRAFLKEDAASK